MSAAPPRVGSLASPLDGALGPAGSINSSLVPDTYDVAVNGRPFRLDTALAGQYQHQRASTPALRQQSDQGPTPGEQSISRDDLWRRSQTSWHHGAGQTYFDRTDSDGNQFLSSRGINVWDRWQLTLLPQTSLSLASTATNLRLTTAGSLTYVTDGPNVKACADVLAASPVWTTVAGGPGSPAQWITTNGYDVWVAHGNDGIYSFVRGATSRSLYTTLPATVLGYVKGRLMAANGPSIYNVTSATPPIPLLTQGNNDFTWVGFAEGTANIYAAGYSGQRSLIYRIGITSDATVLAAPVVAGELPTGEQVTSVKGYLGYLVIGSNLGVRLASVDGGGNLLLGALIPTPQPVLNFEVADRFVWFALSGIDAGTSGLGRLDLSVFTSPLTPAYAYDLEASAVGAVTSISSQNNRRVFAVAGSGVWAQATTLRSSGSLVSSRITYDIADDKVTRFLDLRTTPLVGSITASVASSESASVTGVFNEVGVTRPGTALSAGELRGAWFSVTVTLTAASGNAAGPTLTRYTLRSYPAPSRSFTMTVPLLLADDIETVWGDPSYADTPSDRAFLESLVRSEQLITYQEDGQSYTVLVDDCVWLPHHRDQSRRGRNGTMVLQMRETSL